ncbi:MAG: hypothetical protein JW720_11160 [Sedimentisphaerales bacterium]|nr:hypothetical protein [Sedimentisphaerales bacterium]
MKLTRIFSSLPLNAAVIILIFAAPAIGRTIYVDADAAGTQNGTTWEDAYNFLQDALTDAYSATEPTEILIAQGIYTPDTSSAVPAGSGDRYAAFQLATDIAVRGGYAGFGQPNPNDRDIDAYQTILSSDLARNDIYVADVRNLPGQSTRSENSYHVIIVGAAEPNAILEGVTVTAGNANGPGINSYGGGILIVDGDPTIVKCTFIENSAGSTSAGGWGGAINNEGYGNLYYNAPTIKDCLFKRNYAVSSGGAISNYMSAPQITACTFTENRSHAGAAVENDHMTTLATTEIKYCTFVENTANSYGGAMYNSYSSPVVTNCLFEANVALDPANGVGGALANVRSYMTMRNCTIAGNRAPNCGSAIVEFESGSVISNSIVWDNPDGHTNIAMAGYFTIDHSCIQYGWLGQGNTDEDPLFAGPGLWDPNGTPEDQTDDFWIRGDYHLKSAAGRWDPDALAWINDDVTSPCIDNGNDEDPVQDELLPNGWIVNMGVFGGTAQASMSLCPSGRPADCYTDGTVDMMDLAMMSARWLSGGYLIPEDIDRDGIVNALDLAAMGAQWKKVDTTLCRAALLSDSFENGQWNGLWTQDQQNDWYISDEYVADANFAAQVDGDAVDAALTSIPMNLGLMTIATVEFAWSISENFDVGEYLAFDVSTDAGATWQEKARLDGDSEFEGGWRIMSFKLRDLSTLQIRFRAKASDAAKKANVDMVDVDAGYH